MNRADMKRKLLREVREYIATVALRKFVDGGRTDDLYKKLLMRNFLCELTQHSRNSGMAGRKVGATQAAELNGCIHELRRRGMLLYEPEGPRILSPQTVDDGREDESDDENEMEAVVRAAEARVALSRRRGICNGVQRTSPERPKQRNQQNALADIKNTLSLERGENKRLGSEEHRKEPQVSEVESVKSDETINVSGFSDENSINSTLLKRQRNL